MNRITGRRSIKLDLQADTEASRSATATRLADGCFKTVCNASQATNPVYEDIVAPHNAVIALRKPFDDPTCRSINGPGVRVAVLT